MSVRNLALPWGTAAPDAYADGRASGAAEQQRAASYPTPERIDLETIYRIRRPDLIRYLVSFGTDLAEAEDITHEIFLKIFENEQKQNQPASLFRWALVCAKNLALNRRRRGRREVPVLASVWKKWEETLPDRRDDTERCLQEEERCRKLKEWISELSDVEQKCALMRSHGITFREIAVALDLPLGRVTYITNVAMQKLKRQCELEAQ